MRSRCTWGFCEVTQRVRSPVESSYRATQARGSMALATSRWFTMRFLTTTSAFLKAASVSAASPICHLKATLPGATSWTWAAPDCAARSVLVTEGRTSQSTSTRSAASRAADCVSAITMATGSPTYRAASPARGMCGGTFSSGSSQPQGRELTPVMSLPVKIATTPGKVFAFATSILRIFALAWGLRTKAA